MPGAKDKSITTHINEIHALQEEVSKWGTRLAGLSDKEDVVDEMFKHITGLGHLEIFKLAEYSKLDTKSAKFKFEQAVHSLNSSMASSHSSWQTKILGKETLPEQQAQVKAYAAAYKKYLDDFKTHWHVHDYPPEVKKAYDHVVTLTH